MASSPGGRSFNYNYIIWCIIQQKLTVGFPGGDFCEKWDEYRRTREDDRSFSFTF